MTQRRAERKKRVVLDANAFLEGEHYSQVQWGELVEAESVELLVLGQVLRELDARVWKAGTDEARDRARQIKDSLKAHLLGTKGSAREIRPGLFIRQLLRMKPQLSEEDDPQHIDVVILACARELSKRDGPPLVIATLDGMLELSADEDGIPVVHPPLRTREDLATKLPVERSKTKNPSSARSAFKVEMTLSSGELKVSLAAAAPPPRLVVEMPRAPTRDELQNAVYFRSLNRRGSGRRQSADEVETFAQASRVGSLYLRGTLSITNEGVEPLDTLTVEKARCEPADVKMIVRATDASRASLNRVIRNERLLRKQVWNLAVEVRLTPSTKGNVKLLFEVNAAQPVLETVTRAVTIEINEVGPRFPPPVDDDDDD